MAERFKKKRTAKNTEPFFIEGKMDISFFVILIALLVIRAYNAVFFKLRLCAFGLRRQL